MGLKITVCICSWGKLWTTRYKETKKTQPPLLKSRENKQGVGSKGRVLRMPPALNTTKAVGHPPKPALQPNPGHTPTLTPYKEPAWSPWEVSKHGNLLLVFAPLCCSRDPNKAFPEFLVWPLINFYWLRRPRTLVGNRIILTRADWRMNYMIVKICPPPSGSLPSKTGESSKKLP